MAHRFARRVYAVWQVARAPGTTVTASMRTDAKSTRATMSTTAMFAAKSVAFPMERRSVPIVVARLIPVPAHSVIATAATRMDVKSTSTMTSPIVVPVDRPVPDRMPQHNAAAAIAVFRAAT